MKEVQLHMSSKTSGSRNDVCMDYLRPIKERLTLPLLEQGEEGIESVLETMHAYSLDREDWDSIIELSHFGGAHNAPSAFGLLTK
jgi:hypothetical protein